MTRRLLAGLALAVGLIAIVLPQSTWAWTPPKEISSGGAQPGNAMAVGAGGDVAFAWTRSTPVKARVLKPGGTLSPIQTLADTGQFSGDLDVAVDPAGNATYVWRSAGNSTSRIQSCTRLADGALRPVRTLSPGSQLAADPQIGLDAQGDAVVLWNVGDESLYARRIASDGSLGPMRSLTPNRKVDARFADMAVDAAGNALVVWPRPSGIMEDRVLRADGSLGPIQAVSPPGRPERSAKVGMDPHGNAVIAWTRSGGAHVRLQARMRSQDGELGPIEAISPPDRDAAVPQLAVDRRGSAVLVWQQKSIRTRTLRANGTLSGVQAVSTPGLQAYGPQVAVNATGSVVYLWVEQGASDGWLEARTRSSTGTFGPIAHLSNPDEAVVTPRLVTRPDGTAVASWEGEGPGGGSNGIEFSLGP